ncbi:unnamed protein product, partial [Phaeothamnion confervicola]
EHTLGWCYEQGVGVEPDPHKTVHWWLRSAEKGIYESQLGLARYYMEGKGVPRNVEQAQYWYHRAIESVPTTNQSIEELGHLLESEGRKEGRDA